MKPFFKELSELLADGQQLELKVTKTGSDLSVHSQTKGANFTATGTPEEFDSELLANLRDAIANKKFTFTIVESGEVKDEEEVIEPEEPNEGQEKQKESKPAKEKKSSKKEASKTNVSQSKEEKEESLLDDPEHQKELESEKKANVDKAEPKKEIPEEKTIEENKLFVYMKQGAKMMDERKYTEALDFFTKACESAPEDKKAIEARDKAAKWVKAMSEL